MPRGKPVVLTNGRQWTNQKLAIAHFQELRDRYPLETPIDGSQDYDDLCALLERYDAIITGGPSKAGCGVSHFFTRENQAHGGKTIGFWVVRADDTETDFSFIAAITGRPRDAGARLVEACRESVHELLATAKANHFTNATSQSRQVVCEVSGEPVSAYDARLDYAPTAFRDIVWAFRIAEGWEGEIPLGILSTPADAQLTTQFVDIDAMARFRMFHASHAQLRVVAKGVKQSQLLASRLRSVQNPVRL